MRDTLQTIVWRHRCCCLLSEVELSPFWDEILFYQLIRWLQMFVINRYWYWYMYWHFGSFQEHMHFACADYLCPITTGRWLMPSLQMMCKVIKEHYWFHCTYSSNTLIMIKEHLKIHRKLIPLYLHVWCYLQIKLYHLGGFGSLAYSYLHSFYISLQNIYNSRVCVGLCLKWTEWGLKVVYRVPPLT